MSVHGSNTYSKHKGIQLRDSNPAPRTYGSNREKMMHAPYMTIIRHFCWHLVHWGRCTYVRQPQHHFFRYGVNLSHMLLFLFIDYNPLGRIQIFEIWGSSFHSLQFPITQPPYSWCCMPSERQVVEGEHRSSMACTTYDIDVVVGGAVTSCAGISSAFVCTSSSKQIYPVTYDIGSRPICV